MNPKMKTLTLVILLGMLILSACAAKSPQPAPTTAVPDTSNAAGPGSSQDTMLSMDDPAYVKDEAQSRAAEIVRNTLASRLKVEASSLGMVAVEPIDWPDACLGESQEGESCAKVVTPGFRITFSFGDQNYTYHTDVLAGIIRQETHVTQVS